MSTIERLDGFGVFAAVVRAGSFTAAARELRVSKSHVSKVVRELEDNLGVRLLNRTTRTQSLTDSGALFHAHCQRVLDEVEAAHQAVSELQGTLSGRMRVSIPMSFGMAHAAPLVAEFMASHPGLEIDLHLSDSRIDIVGEGFDLAVRMGSMPDSSLVAKRLASFKLFVCASPSYLERAGEPITPRDLAKHECLLYALQASASAVWILDGPNGEVSARVSGRYRANNGEALRDAAVAGIGLAFQPDFIIADAVRDGLLIPVLRGWARTRGIWAVYPHGRHVSAKVRAFIDFLAERFRLDAPWKLE